MRLKAAERERERERERKEREREGESNQYYTNTMSTIPNINKHNIMYNYLLTIPLINDYRLIATHFSVFFPLSTK